MLRLLALLLLAVAPSVAHAAPASPLLPPEHWAVRVAARLHEAGLAPEWFPAQRAVPLAEVAAALRGAAVRADPRLAPLARAWARRLETEFPGLATGARGPALLGADVGAGFESGTVKVLAPPPQAWPATLHLVAPPSQPLLEAGAAAALAPWLAAGARGRVAPSGAELEGGELVAAGGPVRLSAGRGPVGYGYGTVGGVVASGRAPLDRLELSTAPLRLPACLGEVAVDTALARLDEARHPYRPLLWLAQLQWRPHPRLTLGASRGVMFGGALWEGVSAGRATLALLGLSNYRENNVYAVSAAYRLPTPLPLTAHLELGTDDNPGAMVTWPGLVAGLRAPLLPGGIGVGVEYAYFGRGPVGWHNPVAWYSHAEYTGGWATGESPLGDPLGGEGRALRLTAEGDALDGRLRLAGVAFAAERFVDSLYSLGHGWPAFENLYAPEARGRSLGGELEAEWRLGRGALAARASYEGGEAGWHRGALALRAKVFF